MKKLLASLMCAGALVAVAAPASAVTAKTGYIWSFTCYTNGQCDTTIGTTPGNAQTIRFAATSPIYNCQSALVPNGAHMNSVYLTRIFALSKNVTARYGSPLAVPTLTCNN